MTLLCDGNLGCKSLAGVHHKASKLELVRVIIWSFKAITPSNEGPV
jgi:hypothetical protein